jgi:hypothetical protein
MPKEPRVMLLIMTRIMKKRKDKIMISTTMRKAEVGITLSKQLTRKEASRNYLLFTTGPAQTATTPTPKTRCLLTNASVAATTSQATRL